jgi:hypothetical protein
LQKQSRLIVTIQFRALLLDWVYTGRRHGGLVRPADPDATRPRAKAGSELEGIQYKRGAKN